MEKLKGTRTCTAHIVGALERKPHWLRTKPEAPPLSRPLTILSMRLCGFRRAIEEATQVHSNRPAMIPDRSGPVSIFIAACRHAPCPSKVRFASCAKTDNAAFVLAVLKEGASCCPKPRNETHVTDMLTGERGTKKTLSRCNTQDGASRWIFLSRSTVLKLVNPRSLLSIAGGRSP
ncbi:unnamed protein product [Periconia digitata]|uniref:Uncharacterized protein n=1 Tax=Periconia digitata TaxID=1303443 RepID=A0A9W4XVT4_9PLEO|nr:unnamed protein product [Periconia digitata]